MSAAGIEELVGITSIIAQSFYLILYRVTMHEIHNHHNACCMCLVNELLKFIWRTETTTWGKEGTYMVAKASIVGMLGNGHYLNAIVAIGNNARKNV